MKSTETPTSGQEKSLTPEQADLVRYLVYLRYSLGFSFIGMKVATLGLDQFDKSVEVDKSTTVDEYFDYADKYFKDFLEAKNEKELKSLLDTLRNEETTKSFKDFSTITDDEKAEILAQRIMCRSMIDKIRTLLPGNSDLAKQTLQNLKDNGPMAACMNLEAEHNIIIMNYYEHGKLSSKLSSEIKEEVNQILQPESQTEEQEENIEIEPEVKPLLQNPQALIAKQEQRIEEQVFAKYEESLPTPASTEAIIGPIELKEASLGEQNMINHNLGSALYDLEEATGNLPYIYGKQENLGKKTSSNFEQDENLDQQAINCRGQIISAVQIIETVSKVVKRKNPKGGELTKTLQKLASGLAELEDASEDPEKAKILENMLADKVGLGNRPH